MNKVISIAVAIIMASLFIVVGVGCANKYGQSRVENDYAERDKDERYLTVINDTHQVINEVHIYVGEGTEIEDGYQENPNEDSFSVKIPKDYKEYDTFKVTLIDRYGLKYEKQITNVSVKGRTEVVISEDDYIEQNGDFKKKIDKFFNNVNI